MVGQRPDDTPSVKPSVPGLPDTPSMAFDGPAVQAMMDAEVALAQQNSATAQLDLQVLGAILNAHSTAVDGRDGLNKLQADTEAAVRTRVDLDTPAGAREFQRFLVGKLRDIRGVLASASLDDTSQSALMMAWTALYHAAANDPGTAAVSPADTALPGGSQKLAVSPAGSGESYLDPLLMDDPGLWAGDDIVPPSTAAPLSTMPTSPSIPNFGGGPMPGVGSMPAWGGSGGLPLPGFLSDSGGDRAVPGLDKALSAFDEADPKDPESPEESAESSDVGTQERSAEEPAAPSADTTVVTLPDGDTVVAPSPQLASVIKTAVAGTAIPDAFRQQGMIIAPPGTPVAKPLTPAEISVGDIGIFTDHYALALGNSKTLLNGQIQHISAVEGPTFLGWEHPPVPISVSQQAGTGAPVPTRPAATAADQAGVLQPAQPAMPE